MSDMYDAIRTAENVLVLAGAGMSADLGVPVYWTGDTAKYGDTRSQYGYTALEHAHATLFFSDIKSQTKYFREQWESMIDVSLEGSHYVALLKHLSQKNYFIATTNVDNFFIRAGYERQRVLEVHGSYAKSQCLKHDHGTWNTPDTREGAAFITNRNYICPTCTLPVRPNVLFFEDAWYVPSNDNHYAMYAYRNFLDESPPEGTVVLEIGVGNTVPRLVGESALLESKGYKVYRINLQEPEASETYEGFAQVSACQFVTELTT